MKKTIGIMILLVCCLISFTGTALAGSFSTLADTGMLTLGDDEAWEKTYKTERGKFKVRFRKLWNSSEKKRYHLIIWQDGKRIADGYCPKNDSGYAIQIYHEQDTGRLFVALETALRVTLMGYEPMNGRLEKYIDSKDYYNSGKYPKLYLHREGDLHLAFFTERMRQSNDYKMTWDESARWFGYRDTMAPPPSSASHEEEEYDEPSYSEPEPEPEATVAPPETPATTAADTSVMAEEDLYYSKTVTTS